MAQWNSLFISVRRERSPCSSWTEVTCIANSHDRAIERTRCLLPASSSLCVCVLARSNVIQWKRCIVDSIRWHWCLIPYGVTVCSTSSLFLIIFPSLLSNAYFFPFFLLHSLHIYRQQPEPAKLGNVCCLQLHLAHAWRCVSVCSCLFFSCVFCRNLRCGEWV